MSRFTLKHWQRRHLQRQFKVITDARAYRRTLAVLELDSGCPATGVAVTLGVTR